VSNRCPRPLAALAAIVFLSIRSGAQTSEVQTFKGEVRSDSLMNFHDYRIELEEINHHGEIYRTDLNIQGDFEFHRLPAGEYQLRVTTFRGDMIQQEFVSVNSFVGVLRVHLALPAKNSSEPGTISMTQLRHPPDRKAIQSYVAAQRFAASGSPEKAAKELEKAVRISPEFADAYTNLAVQHMRLERFEEAAAEMTRAIEIAGPNPLRLCNLAYAQTFLGRREEALVSVRAALRLDGGYLQGHLILGTILAADRRTVSEAIPHLERAVQSFPSAQAILEQARGALSNSAVVKPPPR
jgi:tetratricopeptide (TPR) repeat protein